MKSLIITLILLVFPLTLNAKAQGVLRLDRETKDFCNQIMMDLFKAIISEKGKYEDLSKFTEDNLKKNQHDIYIIQYRSEKITYETF
ncbi:MAG: hypothetical protein HQL27_08930, partial [Candidatus Omnitrophica bacterium]|nr:hypothetical protein [Candidatus Omnitrophota bacterium]